MYLTNETEYIAWSRLSSSIAYVRDMLSSNAELFPKFQVRTENGFFTMYEYIHLDSFMSIHNNTLRIITSYKTLLSNRDWL